MKLFEEANVRFYASEKNLNTKKGFVFYNPLMRINRDFSVLILRALQEFKNRKLNVLELMSASGIRALRIALQADAKSLVVNDISRECFEATIKNFEMNNLREDERIRFYNMDANMLLLKSKSFDYIQIDPFDDVHKFIELSLRRIKKNGILAITTTDTATLSGTYPKTCMRRYCSRPLHEDFNHEFGIRILIKDLQTIAAKKNILLKPLISYHYKHHYGLFFSAEKSKKKSDFVFEKHNYLLYCKNCCNRKITDHVFSKMVLFNRNECDFCGSEFNYFGSFYSGQLCEQELLLEMKRIYERTERAGDETISKETKKYLDVLIDENRIEIPFTFNTHLLAKKHKLKLLPLDKIIEKLKESRFKASRTHFDNTSLRTDARLNELLSIMKG
ncbi:MAG: hypothetical protein ACP5OZ_00165 [Candidatus Woesearchaeota archaeon]